MSKDEPIIEIQSLRKEYPAPNEPLVVLDHLSMDVSRGESVAIMGPSGSGKSTLLHILGTLDRPTSGSVRIDGADPFSYSDDDAAAFRNGKIGFVFQDHCLLPQLTVLENVLTPALASPHVSSGIEDRARDLIGRVGLEARQGHRPAQLSGGERQRAAVARALINSPFLLLGDEPTGNLDRKNADSLGELFLELQKEDGLTLVVVTHSEEFASRFDRLYELREGRLEARGK
jgi:lipoprotein-releasing system ATP-binding protein